MLYDVNGNILINTKSDNFSDNMDLYYDSYELTSGKTTNYIVIRVFKTKKDGTKQYPFVRAPQTNGSVNRMQTAALAAAEDWQLIINSGLGVSGSPYYDGVVIENGTVIYDSPNVYHEYSEPLTIDANGDLSYATYDTTGASLIANNVVSDGVLTSGIVSAVGGFCPIIVDYAKVSPLANVIIHDGSNPEGNHFASSAQRQIIGQFANGDYGIISCGGRALENSDGWTLAEAQDVCYRLGMKFAYNLDGGKSTTTFIGKKPLMDFQAGTSRTVPTFIVFNGSTQFAIPS